MRRGFAALAAAGTFVALATAGPPVDAQEDPADADHLVVVQQTPWVVPGGTFAMRLRVDDAPDDAQLRVSLHGRVGTRSEFARTLGGQGLRSRLTDRQVADLDDLPVDDDGSVLLRIVTGTVTGETPHVELDADREGVYPVLVELLDGDGEVADRLVTHLVRLPDPDPDQLALGAVVVVPVHAPPSHVAPGEIDAAALAPLAVTMGVLLDHPDVAATLLPTPEALAAVLEADPAAAGRPADLAENREVLAGPWVRVDRAAWRQGGLADELDRQLAAGRASLAAALGEVPDDRTAVVAAGGGAAAVAAAVAGGARTVIVPDDDLEPLDEDTFPLTLTRPFEVAVGEDDDATVTALVADTALAAHADLDDPVLGAHRLLADLAVLALDAPRQQRVAVVVLDDGDVVDHGFLEALFDGLDQPPRAGAAPLVRATTVAESLAQVDAAGSDGGADPDDPLVREVVDGDDPPTVAALRDDLAGARAEVTSYRSVFGPDDPLAGEVDELILSAGAAALSGAERDALLATGTDRLRGELGAIHGPPPLQRVTLTAREGQVQLVIANDTGRPADVTVELRGDRLEFPDHPDRQVIVHLAGATTRVDLDVRARSSGDAPLDLRVLTPDGRVELGRSRITVRTTAVSGVGLVLMGAAALFLVVWWTRTILRERGSIRRRHPAHAR